MSNIGSGSGIIPRLAPTTKIPAVASAAPHPLAATASIAASPAPASTAPASAARITDVGSSASASPVDQARVATIRQAIATNSYPVIPTKIGDAIIAFGIMMRMPQ